MGSEEKNGVTGVEPAVELAIVKTIERKLDAFSDDIKQHIDLKIDPIEEKVIANTDEIKEIKKNHDELKKHVNALEVNQAACQGVMQGAESASVKASDKANLSIGKIGLMIAGATLLGGGVVWLLSL